MNDPVGRFAAGKTDVTGVAWGREHAGSELGGKVRRKLWKGGDVVEGTVLGGCVGIVVAALLKVSFEFVENGSAAAAVPEKQAHGWGVALQNPSKAWEHDRLTLVQDVEQVDRTPPKMGAFSVAATFLGFGTLLSILAGSKTLSRSITHSQFA